MSAAERTKDRSNLLQHWEGRVLGLSSATSRKVLSDRPALKPDWGKPTVRNFREEDGNGSYRAILLPERQSSTLLIGGDWKTYAMVRLRPHPAIERAGMETPHLQRGASNFYPNRLRWLAMMR